MYAPSRSLWFSRRGYFLLRSFILLLLVAPPLPGICGFVAPSSPRGDGPSFLFHVQRKCHAKISRAIARTRPQSGNGVRTSEETTHGGSARVGENELPELNQDEIRRYARHLILPDVGVTGQRRLKASSVLAVGTGGLGSPALLYLAAAGIGRLGLVDDDVVDESNLQRQVIHGTSTLGKPKVESARARILDVNPNLEVHTFHEKLTSANALEILDSYDVILDGSDNFPTKYLVSDACEILGTPNVYGAILGFEGQASVFTYKATEVVKIILGKAGVLSGRLLVYDALRMTFKESVLEAQPNRPPVTELIDYQGFCGFSVTPPPATDSLPQLRRGGSSSRGGAEAAGEGGEGEGEGFQRITPPEVVGRMQEGWTPYVLDVRLPQEAEIASLPFVDQLCPHRRVGEVISSLPGKGDILVHCKVGGRSAKACAALSKLGVPKGRLFNMEGGIIRWAEEIDSSLPVY